MTIEQLNTSMVAIREAGITPDRIELLVEDVEQTRVQYDGLVQETAALRDREDELKRQRAEVHKQWSDSLGVKRAAAKQMRIAEGNYCEAVSRVVVTEHPGISPADFLLDVQNAVNSKLTFGLQVVGWLERSLRDGGRAMYSILDVLAETDNGHYRRMTNMQRERVAAVIKRHCPTFPGTDRYLPPYLVD